MMSFLEIRFRKAIASLMTGPQERRPEYEQQEDKAQIVALCSLRSSGYHLLIDP